MFSRYRNAFREKRSEKISFFTEIETGCSRELLQLGFSNKTRLIPGGVKVAILNDNHPPLQEIAHLPILELDVSALRGINYNELSGFNLIGFTAPRGSQLDCSTLTQFDLIKLSAEGCRITNPEAMNHHSLRYLSLAKSDLSTLDFFHGNELESLNMEETKIADLEPLSGQKFLKKLNLFRTRVSCLKPLKGLPIEDLVISATQVSDLEPISGSKLKFLEMRATQVHDLVAVSGLPLSRLVLPGSPVTSVEAISNCPIRELNMIGIQLKSLAPLLKMPLETLALSTDGFSFEQLHALRPMGIKNIRSPCDPLGQSGEEFFVKHTTPSIKEDS